MGLYFLKDDEIREIFKSHIKIESKVVSIESLFANVRRMNNTVYDPYYQRNYVWEKDKATYFIESILLGTEIPPLVFFNTGSIIEVIDGRQRFETIKKFINNEFHLTAKGLSSIKGFAKKSFNDLSQEIQSTLWDTTLRIIEFGVINEPRLDERKEDLIKKEIFRRYNSGITPLKNFEIEKAIYIDDNLSSFMKKQLKNSMVFKNILELFFVDRDMELIDKTVTLEKVMQKLRLFLVLPLIPINYYATTNKRKDLIARLYENMSNYNDDVDKFYLNFINKINILVDIRNIIIKNKLNHNRLVFECLFWAISIIEKEGINVSKIKGETYLRLTKCISNNIDKYEMTNSHFYKALIERFSFTAKFFENEYKINLDLYLSNYDKFKPDLKEIFNEDDTSKLMIYDTLRLNRPDASTTTIEDICRQMLKRRFLLRPSYQRGEIINKAKSSSIIESILLDIKIPPIFIYKRESGISEVVDGQQRLLSILGFIGQEFIDENGNRVKTEKNNFSLSKLTILSEYNGMKYQDLSDQKKDKILDFNLSIVIIDEKLNPHFDPIDLFIRLNNKPYPIKENSFEMWNSYIDKEIVTTIKENTRKHSKWFYSKVNSKRMEDEELYASLVYLEYKIKDIKNEGFDIEDIIDVYVRSNRINARIKHKTEITKTLNEVTNEESTKLEFLKCIKIIETFIKKVRTILIDKDTENADQYLREELDRMFTQNRRTFQNFYTLWYILCYLNYEMIKYNRIKIKGDITTLFQLMKNVPGNDNKKLDEFLSLIKDLWSTYRIQDRNVILSEQEKAELIKIQKNICPICNSPLFFGDDIHIDHIKPLAIGGRDSIVNLQATHKDCNQKKNTKYI